MEAFDLEVERIKGGGAGAEEAAATSEVAVRELEGGGGIEQEAGWSGFGDDGVAVFGVGNSRGRGGRRGRKTEEDEEEEDPSRIGEGR